MTSPRLSRRTLLIGGGAGVGLLVAWAAWPRSYAPNLAAAPGGHVYGAWLKLGEDGQVTVAVPQCEHGQGVWTVLPQIVADELGADWRTVGVEPAPLNPIYANPLAADALLGVGMLPEGVRREYLSRATVMLTGASTSVRMFEDELRQAGAAARALLCKAAARRWDVDWASCHTEAGFVVAGQRRLRFADLAAAAAQESVPDPLPLRADGKLLGRAVPRLDAPAKVDGSALFAGDVRLPDMVFASVRAGPTGASRLLRVDRAAADRIPGVLSVVEAPHWVAAVGNTWWAANRALDALAPRFETKGGLADSASIAAALETAFAAPGERMARSGDIDAAFKGVGLFTAEYRVGAGMHAAIEPMIATAHWRGDALELWAPTQAPAQARDAAARAADLDPAQVILHPMLAGGSFGANLEHDAIAQAAVLAKALRRPVQLGWSRGETLRHDRMRAPAIGKLAARLAPNGAILGWHARVAAPATGAELARRVIGDGLAARLALGRAAKGDSYAVDGAAPAYRVPALAVDHHPATIGIATGHLRGGSHGYTAFFNECFVDEIARFGHSEPVSFRIGMLGGEPRLARCLSTAAALGGWDGGVPGSVQGIACHAMRGSYIAVLVEITAEGDRIAVDRIVAAVDCGRAINPDVVRQQIEGGLIFGLAQALGASTGFAGGFPDAHGFGMLGLPRLSDTPDVTVELIASNEAAGGVGELGVPAVAPAIANAVFAATGTRLRALPLRLVP